MALIDEKKIMPNDTETEILTRREMRDDEDLQNSFENNNNSQSNNTDFKKEIFSEQNNLIPDNKDSKKDEEMHRISTEALLKTGLGMRKRPNPISIIQDPNPGLVPDDEESLPSGQKSPEALEEILTDTNENRKIMRLAERMTKQTVHHDDYNETRAEFNRVLKDKADANFSSVVTIPRVSAKEKT